MSIKDRLQLINKFSDVFTIKTGKLFKLNNKCFKSSFFVVLFFRFYYGGLFLFPLFYLLNNSLFDFQSIFYKCIESFSIMFLMEFLIILIIPINEVSCYKK